MKLFNYKYTLFTIMVLTLGSFVSYAMDKDISNHERPTGPINHVSTEINFHICSFFSSPSDFAHLAQVSTYYNEVKKDVLNLMPNSLIVIGRKGSGVSTLTYLLAGKQMTTKKVRGHGWEFSCEEKLKGIDISQCFFETCTKEPACVFDYQHKRQIWSFPAFIDNLGVDKDFAHAKQIHELLKGKVKIIVCIPQAAFSVEWGSPALHILNCMTEIFPDVNQLKQAMSVVISNRTNQTVMDKLLTDFKTNAETKIPNQILPNTNKLLQSFANDPSQVIEFPEPHQEGPYVINEGLSSLINDETYILNPQVNPPIHGGTNQRSWVGTRFY